MRAAAVVVQVRQGQTRQHPQLVGLAVTDLPTHTPAHRLRERAAAAVPVHLLVVPLVRAVVPLAHRTVPILPPPLPTRVAVVVLG
jgi:hypothetical protein